MQLDIYYNPVWPGVLIWYTTTKYLFKIDGLSGPQHQGWAVLSVRWRLTACWSLWKREVWHQLWVFFSPLQKGITVESGKHWVRFTQLSSFIVWGYFILPPYLNHTSHVTNLSIITGSTSQHSYILTPHLFKLWIPYVSNSSPVAACLSQILSRESNGLGHFMKVIAETLCWKKHNSNIVHSIFWLVAGVKHV